MTTIFVYVDAKDRESGSTSDFVISLAGGDTINFTENTRLRIDGLRVVNAFATVTPLNRYLYVREPGNDFRIIILQTGYFNAYNLSRMIADNFGPSYNVHYTDSTNGIDISRFDNQGFHIYTDAELLQRGNSNPQSFNEMLRNPQGAYVNNSSFHCIFVTTCPYDYIFLRSSRLTSDLSLCTGGARDVLPRIPIHAAFGDVIVANTPWDESLPIGGGPLSACDFRVTDRFNAVVDLVEGSLSFQLTFFQ